MAYKVAVVGATGNVGREMLNILAERQFPRQRSRGPGLHPLDGHGSLVRRRHPEGEGAGALRFHGHRHLPDVGAVGASSKEWSPKIAAQGCIVIDNSAPGAWTARCRWWCRKSMPTRSNDIKKGIIANPNCSTAQLVVALKPLHDVATIKRVVVSTYQSVSGAGKEAMDELFRQTRAVFVADPIEKGKFTKQIAFNVIPHIDVFLDSGYTKEEWKMMVETQKILDPDIQVTATCVRVPVFVGHSEGGERSSSRSRSPPSGPAPSCARRRACWWSISARTAATSRRSNAPARTPPMSAASARTRRSRTGCRCGSCPTICARARRSTRCRSPRA